MIVWEYDEQTGNYVQETICDSCGQESECEDIDGKQYCKNCLKIAFVFENNL